MEKKLFKPFGELGIKLKNNFLDVIKPIPKWRVAVLFALVALFTSITTFLFSEFFDYLIFTSVTLTNLNWALVDIIGHSKYQTISDFVRNFSKIFIALIFIFYSWLFYRWEKKKQYMSNLKKIMEETLYMAEGNLEHQLQTHHQNDLDLLATNINNIVLRLKEAIEEELHVEHTKNELITNVSHDLRTPLTSIVGYLRLIEQDDYRDEVALRHYTGIAYKKALSLEHLINELFEYTRMQDQKLVLNKVPINIAEILGQITIQNELYFTENHIICREHISAEQPVVLGDGERLARVFDNLITNAIHYGKEGKYVDIAAEENDNQVVVTVTNYGNKIPSLDLPHIFERFYRAEKSRSTNTGGSGLGLAIAKSIVTNHDGTIEVVSDIEKTSFIVKLQKIPLLTK